MMIENQGAVAPGETPTATAKRWAAELAAAKGRKPEAKAANEPTPEPEPYVPGAYLEVAEEMSAKLFAAKRVKLLTVLGGELGSHKLPLHRA